MQAEQFYNSTNLFFAVRDTRSAEQRDAELTAKILPFFALVLKRMPFDKGAFPTPPPELRAELEAMEIDLQNGDITKHYGIEWDSIRPKTEAATYMGTIMACIYGGMGAVVCI